MKPEKTRNLSLQTLRAIEALNDFEAKGFLRDTDTDLYLEILDPNPDSDFFFKIEELTVLDKGKVEYVIDYKPASEDSSDGYKIKIGSEQLPEFYESWKKLVLEYEKFIPKQSPFDPILEQYEEEFLSEFELVDEDAERHSFPTKTQLLLDAYLGKVVEKLEQYKINGNIDEATKSEIDEIIDDAIDLQNTQTKQTKSQVVKKLANILAQCKKISLKVLGEVRSEIVKSLVKGAMEDPQAMLDSISGFLS